MLRYHNRASKNTDSSVFYTEIETKIFNTHFDQKILDCRDPTITHILFSLKRAIVRLTETIFHICNQLNLGIC